jgi:tetratricopeptide (TPR) repeat protein
MMGCIVVLLGASRLRGQPAAPSVSASGTQPAVNVPSLVRLAVDQYDKGDYQASIETLSKVLEANPQDTAARFFRALAYGQLAVPAERRAQIAEIQNRADEAAQQERITAEQYTSMRKDIEALLHGPLTNATAIVQLIDAVVATKLASYAAGSYEERVAARATLLQQAHDALEAYLHPAAGSGVNPPKGLNRVRAEYFLGVVVYRQALRPAEQAGEPDDTADRTVLDVAGNLMQSLVDPTSEKYIKKELSDAPESDVAAWLSYANLYLGLIRTRQGTEEAIGGDPVFKLRYGEALDHFKEAWKLDTGEPYPQGEDKSAGRGLIPQIAEKHVPELQKALKGPGPTEDLYIDWESGFAYDTNVILLGHNTALPYYMGRKEDVRFGTGMALGYTLDLAKISPGLERWTFGALGRTSANWHGDIYEFNEQNYGGSAALQYRMLDAWLAGNRQQGPLYVSLQYDYDYFLLGNKGFLSLNRISPQFTLYTLDQRAISAFSFHYEDRQYFGPNSSNHEFTRDGNYFAFDLSQSIDLVNMTQLYKNLGWQPWGLAYDPTDPEVFDPNNPRQDVTGYYRYLRPYVGFEYGWDSTRGKEFDTNRYLLVAGVTAPLPYGVLFDFGGQWEWQPYYHHPDLIDYRGRTRYDFIQRYRFGLERRFVLIPGDRINRTTIKIDRLVMSLRADVQLTDDDSNVKDRMGEEVFTYDRAIWGLSVSFQFN